MSFKEVDDELWRRTQYYMPSQKPATGRPRADLRTTFNGILYVLYTGCSGMKFPKSTEIGPQCIDYILNWLKKVNTKKYSTYSCQKDMKPVQ